WAVGYAGCALILLGSVLPLVTRSGFPEFPERGFPELPERRVNVSGYLSTFSFEGFGSGLLALTGMCLAFLRTHFPRGVVATGVALLCLIVVVPGRIFAEVSHPDVVDVSPRIKAFGASSPGTRVKLELGWWAWGVLSVGAAVVTSAGAILTKRERI